MTIVHLLFPSILSCQTPSTYANAFQIDNLNQTIGGPKAMARPGDFIIENDRIRIAINGSRPSMGPHTAGGGVIDADLQRNDLRYNSGHGNDQLAELFATVNMNTAQIDSENGEIRIMNDGSDGNAAVICTVGEAEPFITILDGLWAILGGDNYTIRTDYRLAPNSPVLEIQTTAMFGPNDGCDDDLIEPTISGSAGEVDDILTTALSTGVALGDFYLQGGSLNVFTPGIGFDETGHVFELNQVGINTFADPIETDFIAGTGTDVSYGLWYPGGSMFVPMFTSSQTIGIGAATPGVLDTIERFPEGSRIQYTRWFTVGEGDVGSVVDHFLEAECTAVGTVQGHVLEEGTGVALSGVHVFAYKDGDEAPYLEWQTDVGDDLEDDGSFRGTLPVGSWEIEVYKNGRPKSDRIPITVKENETLNVVLGSPQPGSLSFVVRDEMNQKVPSKLSFFSTDGSTVLDPVLGDSYISGEPASVVFASHGQGHLVLPPGEYYAVASRGIEYELDISDNFTIDDKSHIELDFQVLRSVESPGWLSADFHVHSSPSHDSGVSPSSRVSTMACEGVEYFTPTDHDFISDFDPVVQELGLENWINTAPGTEVTTIEVGHYLGFPVRVDRQLDNGGAIDWTDLEPQELIDGLRELKNPEKESPVVYVGHPRDGILGYFDQYGFSPYLTDDDDISIEPSFISANFNELLEAANFSTDFDGIEILNGKRFELLRTPTQLEMDLCTTLNCDGVDEMDSYDMISRTLEEQTELENGVYQLGYDYHGQIDDWFTLLNLGYRYTALGNSDAHGKTSIEAGCPRNFVMVNGDSPLTVDDDEIALAVKEGRVVASYGPFVEFYANGDPNLGVGSEITGDSIDFTIRVQSPTWFNVDRVELYENGSLIEEIEVESPNIDILNLETTLTVQPTKDSWYVVIAMGNDDLSPVFTAVEIPPVQLQDVITDALGDVEGASSIANLMSALPPVPRAFPVYPFALTNPIWVDANGDGDFDPPGLQDWLTVPLDPNAE